MGTIRTAGMSLEKNTKLAVEHTDRNGTVHRFKIWRMADGKWCNDEGYKKGYIDLYEFDKEGKKPNFKLRFKEAGSELAAWVAAAWADEAPLNIEQASKFIAAVIAGGRWASPGQRDEVVELFMRHPDIDGLPDGGAAEFKRLCYSEAQSPPPQEEREDPQDSFGFGGY